jgi:hypothetical protein
VRAGSLSDPRLIALVAKYFVCARMPELCTKQLIACPRDVALLERLDAGRLPEHGGRYPWRPGFWGGEREAFLTPDGELLDVFLSLGTQGRPDSQFLAEQRENPEPAVDRFFDRAAHALEQVLGELPADFEALRDGSAPEVAAIRAAAPPPPPAAAGEGLALRVDVRNDRAMYTDLCGTHPIRIPPAELAGLAPDAEPREWPRATILRIAHAATPRGAVLPRLADDSIDGRIVAQVTRRDGSLRHGTLSGALSLLPREHAELGQRKEARMWFTLRARLIGDFTWDERRGTFTSLRLVSEAAELSHVWGGKPQQGERYRLAVTLQPER